MIGQVLLSKSSSLIKVDSCSASTARLPMSQATSTVTSYSPLVSTAMSAVTLCNYSSTKKRREILSKAMSRTGKASDFALGKAMLEVDREKECSP